MITALRRKMHQDLQLAGLSDRTQEAYLRAVRQLADHFHTPPDRLTEPQLRDYLLHLKNHRKFASASLMVAYCGIKFFYSHTAPRDWATLRQLRVRRVKALPDVLSVQEVRQLIDAVRTLHIRTYFWTVYSLGLRLEEGLHLQVGDIDSADDGACASGQGSQGSLRAVAQSYVDHAARVLGDPSAPDLAVPGQRARPQPSRLGRRPDGAVERATRDAAGGARAEVPEGHLDAYAAA